MPTSHHRKKHKEHLRHFQHTHEPVTTKAATGGIAGTIAIIGLILGIAVGYFATDGILLWTAFGAVIGGLLGFLGGRYFDKVNK